jgi:peptide deformylase
MAVRGILLLGNPALRNVCTPVRAFGTAELGRTIEDLRATLSDFRARHGFGRGIAAPQIGASQRVVVLITDELLALINPVIVRRSRKQMMLWDDCLSFPDLLVKVKRSLAIDIRYVDAQEHRHQLHAEGGLSELVQHEIDHCDGILALDRAVDSRHIVLRSEFERWGRQQEMVL